MKSNVLYHRLTILSVAVALFIFGSCNKLLEVDPGKYTLTEQSFYNTEDELQNALRGAYSYLASGNLYGAVMLGRMGLDADEGYINNSVDRGTLGYYDATTTDIKVLNYWQTIYRAINNINSLLAQVDKPSIEISENERNNIKGQALFLRGYYYFMLVTKFGEIPLLREPTSSSGLEALQVPGAPIQEIYESIISDMEEASTLVYNINSVESPGRVSKSVVWGMLSRVCLHMAGDPVMDKAKYADAAHWAKLVIESGYHELNPSYEQIFINYAQDKYDSKESIWEVEFYGDGSFWVLPKAGKSKRFTVNQAETLVEAQTLNLAH